MTKRTCKNRKAGSGAAASDRAILPFAILGKKRQSGYKYIGESNPFGNMVMQSTTNTCPKLHRLHDRANEPNFFMNGAPLGRPPYGWASSPWSAGPQTRRMSSFLRYTRHASRAVDLRIDRSQTGLTSTEGGQKVVRRRVLLISFLKFPVDRVEAGLGKLEEGREVLFVHVPLADIFQ